MRDFFKKNWKWILCFVIVFLCSLVLPFSGDDFDWGAKSLSEFGPLLQNTELNGRYVGNFIVILLTKNIVIRSLITALVLVGIVYIIHKETEAPSAFVWVLLILMPLPIFVQGITWASGFTNYTISTLLLLLIFSGLRKIFSDEATRLNAVGVSILVFLTSFFLENVTVFLLILTAILNVIYYIKNKKVNWALLATFVLSLVGTILMFIQPTYQHVFAGEDFYRSFASSITEIVKKAIINYVFFMHEYIAFDNVVLLFTITGALYLYYKKNNKDCSDKQNSFLKMTFYYSLVFLLYATLVGLNPEWQIFESTVQLYINALFTGLYIVALVAQIIMLFYKKKCFWRLLMPLCCIIGLLAPLLLVTPIGPRNFFMIYILEMIETFYILREAKFDYGKCQGAVLAVVAVMLIYYVSIYTKITIVNLQRDNYIKYVSDKTDDTLAIVPLVPFNEFVHYDNFQDDMARPKYNRYKNIRDNLTYEFISYDDWVKKMEEDGYEITP